MRWRLKGISRRQAQPPGCTALGQASCVRIPINTKSRHFSLSFPPPTVSTTGMEPHSSPAQSIAERGKTTDWPAWTIPSPAVTAGSSAATSSMTARRWCHISAHSHPVFLETRSAATSTSQFRIRDRSERNGSIRLPLASTAPPTTPAFPTSIPTCPFHWCPIAPSKPFCQRTEHRGQ